MNPIVAMILAGFNILGGYGHNDNEVLFGAEAGHEMVLVAPESKELYCEKLEEFANNTRVVPGVFHRNQGRVDMINSHDNYVGMASGSALCGRELAQEIRDALIRNGWNFNNVQPFKWDLRGQLLPRDTSIIQLAAGDGLGVLDTLYLSAHFCYGGSYNLDRQRLHVWDLRDQERVSSLSWLIIHFCAERARNRVDYIETGCGYHGMDSAICKALKENKGRWHKEDLN